jgi:hypothetical protein
MGEPFIPKYPQAPVPVPAAADDRYKSRPPLRQPTLWELCQRWLRYQGIQVRWDIERRVVRLLRRPWGSS